MPYTTRRLLIIVDPQIDFITGILPVPGAAEAMNALAEYIQNRDGYYVHKVITADRHPYNHTSFIKNGGQWPMHCVHDTEGAAVWHTLFDSVYQTSGAVTFLYKGQRADIEEYSIFKNHHSAHSLAKIVKHECITHIDLCGLAGDVCVADTLRDGKRMLKCAKWSVLTRFAPSFDSGETLSNLMKTLKICDR